VGAHAAASPTHTSGAKAPAAPEHARTETQPPFNPAWAQVAFGIQRHATVAAAAQTAKAGGTPLPRALRSYFEPRFGHDFSQVRVHTDAGAATAARGIQARAYTLGRDVVFGAGEYAPATEGGKRLLAHELTHVIQQASEPAPIIQRAVPFDFQIEHIAPNDAADTSMIFFDRASTTLVPGGTEEAKIAALAKPAAQDLTLNGFDTEEDAPAVADATIQARLATVDKALKAAGHTGKRAPVNLRASSIGQINYRHARAVEVLPTPVGLAAAPSGQNACAAPGSENAPCGAALTSSLPIATAAMAAANAKLAKPADKDAKALLARLFSGVPRATVVKRMTALEKQVGGLMANHRCHSSCDGGCGRPAYNDPPKGAVGGQMTLCPDFLTSTDTDWQARTLIHESAHGTPKFGAEDIAYSSTRQVAFLSPGDQLRNTDSYVLLAWLLAHPGSIPIGPATPDAVGGMVMSAAEEEAAHRSIAWLESWLNYGDFDTELLYSSINRALPPAVAWQKGDESDRSVMHSLAPLFGLTDPGTKAPFALPTLDDKVKVAGIHDRFDQMYKAVNWQVLTIMRSGPGSDAWGGTGPQLPRLAQVVTLGPDFFKKNPTDQIKQLVLLMAKAMYGITPAFEGKYPDALDVLRKHRSLGP
jgi:hypothetical protein